jgi:hypothetical protein
MLKSIEILFERLAQRCLAIAAGMLVSKLESLHLGHWAEHQRQLEEQARALEADGAGELAHIVRDRLKNLSSDDPGAYAESWLQQLAANCPVLGSESDSAATQSLLRRPPLTGTEDTITRRSNGRSKRHKSITAAESTTAPPPAATDVFFPLDSGSQSVPAEDAP